MGSNSYRNGLDRKRKSLVLSRNSILWRFGICQGKNVIADWRKVMDKIYRRATQVSGTAKKKKVEKNRVRNTIMNFRVSPQEKELIDARIALTGLPRAEYFISSCLYQKILVKGNVKTFGDIKAKIVTIADAVTINSNIEELDPELRESLRIILEILDSFYGEE